MQHGTTIASIEIYKLYLPLKEPFVISLGPIHDVQNVVVIIRTQDGCAGYGECSPYMAVKRTVSPPERLFTSLVYQCSKGTNWAKELVENNDAIK